MNKILKPLVLVFAVALSSSVFSQAPVNKKPVRATTLEVKEKALVDPHQVDRQQKQKPRFKKDIKAQKEAIIRSKGVVAVKS